MDSSLLLYFALHTLTATAADDLPEGESGTPPVPEIVAPGAGRKAKKAAESASPTSPTAAPAEMPSPPPGPASESPEKKEKKTAAEIRADDFFAFSDYVDTRVTFALSNINVFAGPGERKYVTSGYRIGIDRNFNLFLENVHTRFSGYESLSHLVLYKKLPSFFENVETEAALAALVLADTDTGRFSFFDSGTYLRITYRPSQGDTENASRGFNVNGSETGSGFDITAFPVSSDRFRLGYTYLISWGGTSIFPGKLQSASITEGAVPGLRLRYRSADGRHYAFLGMKTALLLSREAGTMAGEQIPNYGFLGGAGTQLGSGPSLILEANAGFFQKGTQERPGIEGKRILAYGASARATLFDGVSRKDVTDYRLYRNDPTSPVNYDMVKPWKLGTGYNVAFEGTMIAQNLEDPDRFGSEKLVPAVALGLVANAQFDKLLLTVSGFFQTMDFILFNVPGFVPFQAIPEVSSTTPEFFGTIGARYYLEFFHAAPSLDVGLKVPATYKGAVPSDEGMVVGGARAGEVRTQIVLNETDRNILPPNTDAVPTFGMVLKVPFALSLSTVVAAEARLEVDSNQPRLAQDTELGQVTYKFDDPVRLSLALVLQSRW